MSEVFHRNYLSLVSALLITFLAVSVTASTQACDSIQPKVLFKRTPQWKDHLDLTLAVEFNNPVTALRFVPDDDHRPSSLDVVIGTSDGHFYLINTQSGTTKLQTKLTPSINSLSSGPVSSLHHFHVHNDLTILVVGHSTSGDLTLLDLATGVPLYTTTTTSINSNNINDKSGQSSYIIRHIDTQQYTFKGQRLAKITAITDQGHIHTWKYTAKTRTIHHLSSSSPSSSSSSVYNNPLALKNKYLLEPKGLWTIHDASKSNNNSSKKNNDDDDTTTTNFNELSLGLFCSWDPTLTSGIFTQHTASSPVSSVSRRSSSGQYRDVVYALTDNGRKVLSITPHSGRGRGRKSTPDSCSISHNLLPRNKDDDVYSGIIVIPGYVVTRSDNDDRLAVWKMVGPDDDEYDNNDSSSGGGEVLKEWFKVPISDMLPLSSIINNNRDGSSQAAGLLISSEDGKYIATTTSNNNSSTIVSIFEVKNLPPSTSSTSSSRKRKAGSSSTNQQALLLGKPSPMVGTMRFIQVLQPFLLIGVAAYVIQRNRNKRQGTIGANLGGGRGALFSPSPSSLFSRPQHPSSLASSGAVHLAQLEKLLNDPSIIGGNGSRNTLLRGMTNNNNTNNGPFSGRRGITNGGGYEGGGRGPRRRYGGSNTSRLWDAAAVERDSIGYRRGREGISDEEEEEEEEEDVVVSESLQEEKVVGKEEGVDL